ncbi:MAG TPA: carboxypeptidase regulatory-like domain-containing protein [Longimicrobium sp.]|nr:carboxypeptidase regulatory-like domain-containing protein [Longimicrobium sp.]
MHAKPFLCLLLLLAAATRLPAQTVAGDAVDPASGERISSALVVLVDASGAERASTLTDAAGRFTLRAPAAGAYVLRLERVGYASVTSGAVRLEAGETVQYRFSAAQKRVQLQGLVATGRSRCAPRAQGGVEVTTLLDEASKALRGTRGTEEARAYRYLVKRFARSRRVNDGLVMHDSAETTSATLARPFVSVPGWRLERGWVQAEGNSTVYFAPDAQILSSGFFLDNRCFRVVAGRGEQREWIGLAFEPTRDRRLPDIEGTLWLDSATAELRRLEYRYTGLNIRGPVSRQLGGEMEFHRLPDGAWIVRSWRIRLPQVIEGAPDAASLRPQGIITSLREEGGDVSEIRTVAGALIRLDALAQLAGVVFDSTTSRPLAGARVALEGTSQSAVTDSAGAFVLRDLAEGDFQVTVSHPRLDSLGWDAPARRVALRNGSTARHDVAVPALGTLLTGECGQGAALAGHVRSTEGIALPAAPVTVSWSAAGGAPDSLRAQADGAGLFRFCGVPAGVPLQLRTAAVGATGVSTLRLAAGERGYQELALDLPRGGAVATAAGAPVPAGSTPGALGESRAVTGRLVDAQSGRPIGSATVRLAGVTTLTARDGQFTFEDGVPPGEYEIEIRHGSYPDRRAVVNVLNAPGTEIEVKIAQDAVQSQVNSDADRPAGGEAMVNSAEGARITGAVTNAGANRGSAVALAPITASARPMSRVPSRPYRTLGSRRSIISREQIEPRLKAVRTFGDLARMLGGVSVNADERFTRISSRGERVAVFLDGLYADEIIVRNIQPSSVESMEFIPHGDARWGSGPILLVWTLTGERGSRREVIEKT